MIRRNSKDIPLSRSFSDIDQLEKIKMKETNCIKAVMRDVTSIEILFRIKILVLSEKTMLSKHIDFKGMNNLVILVV